jgi:hypothetical protein
MTTGALLTHSIDAGLLDNIYLIAYLNVSWTAGKKPFFTAHKNAYNIIKEKKVFLKKMFLLVAIIIVLFKTSLVDFLKIL